MIFVVMEFLRGWLMPYPFWIKDLGRRGEYLARRWFHRRGFHLIGKNQRLGKGEIDLIMADSQHLLFVEVKTRTDQGTLRIGDVVARGQEQRLLTLAKAHLAKYPDQDIPWRYCLALVRVAGRSWSIQTADLASSPGRDKGKTAVPP